MKIDIKQLEQENKVAYDYLMEKIDEMYNDVVEDTDEENLTEEEYKETYLYALCELLDLPRDYAEYLEARKGD